MVSFIADSRINRADERRRAMLGQSLTPYKLPANPYGGNPVAGNLQRLAAALGGRWAGQEAASLKKAQLGAQNQILAQLSSMEAPGTAPTLRMSDTGMPMDDMAMQQPRQQQVSRTPYAMDSPSVSAEVLAQAGMQPGAYQLARQKAGAAGKEAYTARQNEELANRLSAVSQSLIRNPENRELYDESQQLRALLDPSEFAKEASAEQAKIRAGGRVKAAKIDTEDRLLKATLAREERDLGRAVKADEKDAIKWRDQYDITRTDRTSDQAAAERRRLGRDLKEEDRDWLRAIDRKELDLSYTLDAEGRADLRTQAREYRGVLRTLDGEKRAVATAIAAEERRLDTTLNAEDRARIAGQVRAKFDDDRADIREIAAAKRKRVDVYNVETGKRGSVTQEMMDIDQEGAAPTYRYEKPDTGKVGFIHFVPTEEFTVGGQKYIPGQEYQVTQENIRANDDLRDAVEKQSQVVKPRQLEEPRVEPKDPPLRPLPPPEKLVQHIEQASAGDLFGIMKSAVDAFTSFFMFADVYPATRDAKEALETMRMTMRVPLVKALSERGSVFTIQQINERLPGSGKTDAQNMALIKNLIPAYYEKLAEAEGTLLNTKRGSQYSVAAAKTISQINSLLPNLRAMANAWDNRKQGGRVTPEGTIRLPSGVEVRRVTGGPAPGSASPTVPTGN
tara:strand:+ start:3972 stop:5999 length:2028 start_codon:yes stop_codon:yes gene_type:complete